MSQVRSLQVLLIPVPTDVFFFFSITIITEQVRGTCGEMPTILSAGQVHRARRVLMNCTSTGHFENRYTNILHQSNGIIL